MVYGRIHTPYISVEIGEKRDGKRVVGDQAAAKVVTMSEGRGVSPLGNHGTKVWLEDEIEKILSSKNTFIHLSYPHRNIQ